MYSVSRKRLLAGLVISLLAPSCRPAASEPVTAAEKPKPLPEYNVLLITLDTTRADRLGSYGYAAARTPALDKLAADGALFEQAYTTCPLTLPAHATLLTGLEPPQHGLRINGGARLGARVPTLATVLNNAGYRTGAFVAAFVLDSQFGLDRGFDLYDDDLTKADKQEIPEPFSVSRKGNLVVDAALEWLGRVVPADDPTRASGQPPTADKQQPFFAWVHLYDPHYPYAEHEELGGTAFEGEASYDGDVAYMDLQIQRLLEFLDRRQLRERTLVVAVADHGEGLGDHGEIEHGYLLNEEVLRIPLLISLPGVVKSGSRVEAMVSSVDLFPTVLDLLGVASGRAVAGRSLRAALEGEEIPSVASYAETDLPYTTYSWNPLRSLTTPEWKYVRTTRPELYERTADLNEVYNLASARPEQLGELDLQLTVLERQLGPATKGERVALSEQDKQRMAALGYASEDRATPADEAAGSDEEPPSGLKDIKDMLATKHLDTELVRGMTMATMGPETRIAIARKLVARSPETVSFQTRLGMILLDANKADEAVAPLSAALKLDPANAQVQLHLGRALVLSGKPDEGIARLREAVRAKPDSVEIHFAMANALSDHGQLDTACGHYVEVLRLQPENADAHYNLANALGRRHRVEAAVKHYEEALRLRPGFVAAHYNLGNQLAAMGNQEGAVVQFAQVLKSQPRNIDAHNNLGVALAGLGRLEEAKAQYQAALKVQPAFARAHFNLANVLYDQGDLAGASAHYADAVRLRPRAPKFAAAYARLLATSEDPKLRNVRQAVELAEAAVKGTKQRDARTLDVLAVAYAAAGRMQDASDASELALRISRSNKQTALASEIQGRLDRYRAVLSNADGEGPGKAPRAKL